MAPPKNFEFVILNLTFSPYVHPQNPTITFNGKTNSPSGSTTQVRDWFDRIMAREKSKISPNLRIHYTEWSITTSNASLFTVNGHRFDQIILILGQASMHWVYYQNTLLHRRIEGRGPLTVNYCGCCFNNQYLQVMDTIKGFVLKIYGQ